MERKEKTKRILNLAIPATIENILQTLVGFIDTLMISRLGLIAVTAIGISNNIFSVYLAVIIALGVAASSLISRSLGAGKSEKTKTIAVQSTALSVLIGVILGLVTILFGEQVLGIMGAESDVIGQALPYFYIVGAATIFISLLTVFGSILRSTGDTKTPMLVNTTVNILNIVLDYILIFGLGPIPALGIVGTAIGTVVARLVGSILMFAKIQQTELAFKFNDMFNRSNYKELIELSIPAVLERLVMRVGQVVYLGLIVSIGVKTYAAHIIAGNIESFTYMPGYGLAAAASILVGNSIGAGNKVEAYEFGKLSMKIGSFIMAIGGVFLFIGSPWFATWFTNDSEAIGKIITALRIDAFAQIPLAISLVAAGALQGAGDTKSPLYSTAIGMWGIRVIGVYILGVRMGMDITGVWLSILIDLTIRSIFLTIKFRSKTLSSNSAQHRSET
ncbi:TPA: MATE family efflux transporter [Listeria monocytogenes]|nr:MATE family efflux transporter [Listeria monocytogenes]HDI3440571.1 MATE family efflux transporter [Listeria monocytogenes]